MPDINDFQYVLNGQTVTSTDATINGRDVRTKAGLNPASNFVLIQIGDTTSHSIGLEEEVNLKVAAPLVFLSFESDRVFSLTINERGFEWGTDTISAANIRLYGNIPGDHELVLDSKGDRLIDDDDVVRLKPKGVERILSRPAKMICIIINTVEEYVPQGKITFEDLVKLAFPDTIITPNIEYTVSYQKGPQNKPEGSLVAGESVKLKKGMVFHVSETDKS